MFCTLRRRTFHFCLSGKCPIIFQDANKMPLFWKNLNHSYPSLLQGRQLSPLCFLALGIYTLGRMFSSLYPTTGSFMSPTQVYILSFIAWIVIFCLLPLTFETIPLTRVLNKYLLNDWLPQDFQVYVSGNVEKWKIMKFAAGMKICGTLKTPKNPVCQLLLTYYLLAQNRPFSFCCSVIMEAAFANISSLPTGKVLSVVIMECVGGTLEEKWVSPPRCASPGRFLQGAISLEPSCFCPVLDPSSWSSTWSTAARSLKPGRHGDVKSLSYSSFGWFYSEFWGIASACGRLSPALQKADFQQVRSTWHLNYFLFFKSIF